MTAVRRAVRVRPRRAGGGRRTVLSLLLVLAVAALSGCGVPRDSSPRVIPAEKVPFSLLGPSTTKPGEPGAGAGILVEVWFLSRGRLAAVSRTVPDLQAKAVLDLLVKGVADVDPAGISSAIPQNTQVISTSLDGDTLTVTLSKEIIAVTGPEQKQAFAQLVYTATGVPGVAGVRFKRIDDSGKPADLEPTTDTGSKQGPLNKSDFTTLAPVR